MNTFQEIQAALNAKFGKGQVKLGARRQDGTVAVKGLWDRRIEVRFFLKKAGLVCLNDVAEARGMTSVIGVA